MTPTAGSLSPETAPAVRAEAVLADRDGVLVMLWGYALIWPGSFLERDPNPLLAKLKFLVHHGLRTTGVDLAEVERLSDRDRAWLGQFVADHELSLTATVHLPYFDPEPDVARRAVDAVLARLDTHRALLGTRLVTTSGGSHHRFSAELPLPAQLDRLAAGLTPFAAGCHGFGLALGIENHGDYYCCDLVELCGRVPHLGIFLDTGNTYLIGEAPLPAFEMAAPFVVGGHFKDQRVRPCPEARPLHFEVAPAVLGEGDVPLRACYRLLLERAPRPADLVMEIEFIPPGDRPMLLALEQSLAFVRSLSQAEVAG